MAAEIPPAEIQVETAGAPTLQPTAVDSSIPSSTLAPKRQRRPSVRLGEIGDQPATLRSAPKSWKLNPHSTSRPSNKTRPLTNLVTSDGDGTSSYEYDAPPPLYTVESNGNLTFDSSLLPSQQQQKLKIDAQFRAAKKDSKRARTNWRIDESAAVDGSNGGQDLELRAFDPHDSPSPSPLREQSADNALRLDEWHAHSKRSARVRVSDSHDPEVDGDGNAPDSDTRLRSRFPDEEVRNWLTELGLGKYSPVFEIHEVDEHVLPFLTLDDLKDMGINAVGSRRKIFCAIQKLGKGFS